MADTDELKNEAGRSHSPDNGQDTSQQTLDDHPESQFPHAYPAFFGYPPDGSTGEAGSPSSGIPHFFPFPPGAVPPGLYQSLAASMPGAPFIPVPIGQLSGVGNFKSKRLQVKNACVNCAQACKKCDNQRPCERCKKYGITESCSDSSRKERKKGIKRGPYKRRLKSGATILVSQEQDGGDADWHPSHDTPTTVDPSILPSATTGANPPFGGPDGFYSYPYPYPLPPPPGEGGSNGEPGAFPGHFFPYPHWQPGFGMMTGEEGAEAGGEGETAGGTSGTNAGGSARTSGGKKKKSSSKKSGEKSSGTGSKRSTNGLTNGHGKSKSKKHKSHHGSNANSNANANGHGHGLSFEMGVTDPSILGDELGVLDPQVANA